MIEYVLQTGATLFASADDVRKLANHGEIAPCDKPFGWWLGIPFRLNNQIAGVMAVHSQSAAERAWFGVSEMNTLELIVLLLSSALERVQGRIMLRDNSSAHQAIIDLNRSLEQRVAERTSQLEAANQQLKLENAEHQRMQIGLKDGRARMQEMAQQVVNASEEERRRISRVLHDEAMQDLMAVTMSMAWLQNKLPAEAKEQLRRLDEAILLAEATTERIRKLAHDIRPLALDTLGLSRAVGDFCTAFAERSFLKVDYSSTNLQPLPGTVSICFYRTVQEGLTNVAKHANARRIWVALKRSTKGLVLTIKDNGCGFDPAELSDQAYMALTPSGVGLRGMQERFDLLHGSLTIKSSVGKGTLLTGMIPWTEINGHGNR